MLNYRQHHISQKRPPLDIGLPIDLQMPQLEKACSFLEPAALTSSSMAHVGDFIYSTYLLIFDLIPKTIKYLKIIQYFILQTPKKTIAIGIV